MLSLSYNTVNNSLQFKYDLYITLKENKNYFYKFCGDDTDLVIQEVYKHALIHFNESTGSLLPYLKSLARSKSKPINRKHKEIPTDFTVADTNNQNNDNAGQTSNNAVVKTALRKTTKSNDFNRCLGFDYNSIDDALNELKENHPIELLYLQKSLLSSRPYTQASRNFMVAFQAIIKQYPNFVDYLKEVDLSELRENII